MNSPKLGLPYLETGQAQKEVTHNEALNIIDVIAQASVETMTLNAPPGFPSDGQAWIVAAGGIDAWAGKDGQIAAWFGGWRFIEPAIGWRAYDLGAGIERFYDGTTWGDATPPPNIPALDNSWIAYGGAYASPRYYKTADGRVTIEGMMQAGTDGKVFTLLAGFRPAEKLMFCCWSGGGAYRVEVEPSGDVIVTASNAVFSSLSGVAFFAD